MAKNSSNTPTFADFWAAYPVHKDRKRAEHAWQQLTATDRRAAIAALPGYIADCQRNGIDKYKYAQGWLNGRRWEDEYTSAPEAGSVSQMVSGTKKEQPDNSTGSAPSCGIETW